ncbi:hypothetical protein Q8W71_30015 [Methylobacterium sp. NEAU 140]|uniref:hypothetical protein n=1 Tax=Methylobacterium sp. NEAU 140 TaxID=3064945 RepID=UPI002735E85C|nr:hypothetical protein [Methylobacterium sp. NEAU 140]MDP4026837.1 hypothetical protein [Methylobacterium sp. NEAU 140]
MKVPSEMTVRGMTPEGRALVRDRASKLDNEVGRETVALIDSLNLPLSSGGMSLDDPLYREMQEVVWSARARAAALDAVKAGLPALAGVDPILQEVMGSRYGREAQGTMNAGSLAAEVMRHLGYEKVGDGPLPENCIAKTAATWKPKAPLR